MLELLSYKMSDFLGTVISVGLSGYSSFTRS